MKLLLPLAHYHIIYLIIKLIRINLMLLRLEDCSISIEPFTDPLSYKSLTSFFSLNTRKKTNVLLHTMNFGVCFHP
jgi:hypothetical protein